MDRRRRDLLIGGIGTLVVTIVGGVAAFIIDPAANHFVTSTVLGSPGLVGALKAGLVAAAVVAAWSFVATRPRLRADALVLSQRRLAYPLLVAGEIVLAGLILWAAGVPLGQMRDMPVAYTAGIAAALMLVALSLGWLLYVNHLYVKADQVYFLLRKLDDQRISGKYDFDLHAPAREIRREARILDYMGGQQNAPIAHARLPLVWRYRFPDGAPAAVTPASQPPTTVNDRQEELAKQANDIWIGGDKTHRWVGAGDPVEPVRFADLFGNQLDRLFNGGAGFRTYATGGPRFVTMVIKGPPGAGKSTLALQMSVTLARQGNLCMYYSLEEERGGLLQSATNFGWDRGPAASNGVRYEGVHHLSARQSRVMLRGRRDTLREQEHTARATGQKVRQDTAPSDRMVPARPDAAHDARGMVLVSSLGNRAMRLSERKRRLRRVWGGRLGESVELPEVVRCVVIDSLEGFANVGLDRKGQIAVPRNELLDLKDFFRHRCELLVILVEDDGSNTPGFVEFVADVVIQLGRRVEDGYTFLFAEVVKARNQTHALGQSQIKIRTQVDIESSTGAVKASVAKLPAGVIVYPSLHYRLFQSQQQSTFDDYILSTGLDGLDELLTGDPAHQGLRRKSAIALLGQGGTGKSLVGMNFLVEGVRENTQTLLLALRDDAGSITSRRVPQEAGRMRFAWGGGTLDDRYHQFHWDLDGILHWSEERRKAASDTTRHLYFRSLRLPYLFARGPVLYRDFGKDGELKAQAAAVTGFLEALASKLSEIQRDCPWSADPNRPPTQREWRRICWVDDARKRAAQAYNDVWSAFEGQLAAGTLVLEAAGVPKRIRLLNVPGGILKPELAGPPSVERDGAALGENDPPPCLHWDSRRWDGGAGKVINDTGLLVVKDWRPGNITPDDFMDQVLRIIGEPPRVGAAAGGGTTESLFERVVFDDVSQLRQRFPFLAKTRLFVPTLIDMFKASGITSLFLADTDSEADLDRDVDHGLATIADHVISTRIKYRVPVPGAGSGSADSTGSGTPGTSAGMQPATKLADVGEYRDRIMVAEVRARPGSEQQVPHRLAVRPLYETENADDHMPDAVEMTRIE